MNIIVNIIPTHTAIQVFQPSAQNYTVLLDRLLPIIQ